MSTLEIHVRRFKRGTTELWLACIFDEHGQFFEGKFTTNPEESFHQALEALKILEAGQ